MMLKNIEKLREEQFFFEQEAKKRELVVEAVMLVENLNSLGNEGDVVELSLSYDQEMQHYNVSSIYNKTAQKPVGRITFAVMWELEPALRDATYNTYRHTVCRNQPQELLKKMLGNSYAYYESLWLEEQLPIVEQNRKGHKL